LVKKDYGPTEQEIAYHFFVSTGSAHMMIVKLCNIGALIRTEEVSRSGMSGLAPIITNLCNQLFDKFSIFKLSFSFSIPLLWGYFFVSIFKTISVRSESLGMVFRRDSINA
jgi:hypothetical protein